MIDESLTTFPPEWFLLANAGARGKLRGLLKTFK